MTWEEAFSDAAEIVERMHNDGLSFQDIAVYHDYPRWHITRGTSKGTLIHDVATKIRHGEMG